MAVVAIDNDDGSGQDGLTVRKRLPSLRMSMTDKIILVLRNPLAMPRCKDRSSTIVLP